MVCSLRTVWGRQPRGAEAGEVEAGLMRHGQEMVWVSLRSFSEKELPLSYNAHSRGRAQSINRLRDQPFEKGMTIYIYRERERDSL